MSFSFYGQIISRNSGLNKGQQASFPRRGIPLKASMCGISQDDLATQPDFYETLHSTRAGDWGLEKSCPEGLALLEATPGRVRTSPSSGGWESSENCRSREPLRKALSQESPVHTRLRLGHRGHRLHARQKSALDKPARSGPTTVEWCLWRVSYWSLTGELSRDVLLQNLQNTRWGHQAGGRKGWRFD